MPLIWGEMGRGIFLSEGLDSFFDLPVGLDVVVYSTDGQRDVRVLCRSDRRQFKRRRERSERHSGRHRSSSRITLSSKLSCLNYGVQSSAVIVIPARTPQATPNLAHLHARKSVTASGYCCELEIAARGPLQVSGSDPWGHRIARTATTDRCSGFAGLTTPGFVNPWLR
jgi:hypothetical protein